MRLFGDFSTGSVAASIALMTAIAAVQWTLLTAIVATMIATQRAVPGPQVPPAANNND